MNEAIQASNLAKSFGLTRALDGLDLSVKKSGEVHGFLGPNGAARRRSCASCSGCCGPTRARRGCWAATRGATDLHRRLANARFRNLGRRGHDGTSGWRDAIPR